MKKHRFSRRGFLRGTAAVSAGAALAGCAVKGGARAGGAAVNVCYVAPDAVVMSAPGQWAVGEFVAALKGRGIAVTVSSDGPLEEMGLGILVTGPGHNAAEWPAESFAIARIPGTSNGPMIGVNGADGRGLVYALTDLAERVRLAADPMKMLMGIGAEREQPALRVRSVMRVFASELEDKPWFYDKEFWTRYLTVLAASRFNRFNLAFGLGYDNNRGLRDTYLYFAYPFLLKVPGFEGVRVNNLPEEERDRNLAMVRFISDETAKRGLHFQLGIWTHAYEALASPEANHLIEGLTPQTHGPYCREAMRMLLRECPNINGITYRIHGESGVAEGNYDLWKMIFSGTQDAGRPILIDMHAKGMDDKMIDTALSIGNPVSISPKFWAEHLGLPYQQAAIRELEMPKATNATGQFALSNGTRSFLRYGYGDLLTRDRKYQILYRIWPGTQRFLLWADPAYASDYGRCLGFGGAEGYELFDPLSFKGRQGSGVPGHRTAYTDASGLQPEYDHEKFLLTYRLWGRLTYNPDAPAEVWKREYAADFGPAAGPIEAALAAASRILPLVTTVHLPSAANLSYWPEIYTTLSMTDGSHPGTFTDTPSPKTFVNVSPIDPQMFAGMTEWVDAIFARSDLAKVSPITIAQQLDAWADTVDAALGKVSTQKASPALRRAILDARILAATGRFFAHKFRAGVMVAAYSQLGDAAVKARALEEYRSGREAWVKICDTAGNNYVSNIAFGPNPWLQGHWKDRLAGIEADIVALEKFTAKGIDQKFPAPTLESLLNSESPAARSSAVSHEPPNGFVPGEGVKLTLTAEKPIEAVDLRYRHVNQGERWETMSMARGAWATTIPGGYTQSPFALEYYFEITSPNERPARYPGFRPQFRGQPYYVLNPQ